MFNNLKMEITARLATAATVDKIIFAAFMAFLIFDLVTLNWLGALVDAALLGYVYWSAGA